VTQGALGIVLSLFLLGGGSAQQLQQSVPDAPAPQPASNGLSELMDQVTPGKGALPVQPDNAGPSQQQTPPPAIPPSNQPSDNFQSPPAIGHAGQPLPTTTFTVHVTHVVVPVTVRDKKGSLVPGLTWRQFRVYEDNVRQQIVFFSSDAYPLSIAFVIDQTLPSDVMRKVNDSLSAFTAGLTPADSVAVVTYGGTGPSLITNFTAATSARLPAALQRAKKPGSEVGVPLISGPLAEGPIINGQQVDPNLAPQRGNAGGFLLTPKETHPLNDAILYAGNLLASQPAGRKRIIYVISDGHESRSKATYHEVVRYLLTNNIAVYGTLVGDASAWGIGYLDKVHLPLLPPDNVMPKYAIATGGSVDGEFGEDGMQKSFAHITDAVRGQYTLEYVSHASTLAGKYHNIDVRVEGIPNLTIQAKAGYWPSASMR
jgi:VWFA-related protein